MSFFEGLHKLVLGPIELLFDVIFALSMQMTKSPVLSIVVLSLAINLLVLPLYRKADAMQREEQEISKRLKPRIDQIKEAFTGDERFMMLQTYYRQNNYRPYYVLRGSLSLLLQIPFFMAAYNFLSGLSVLEGVSFGPVANLAAPDGMLKIGGAAINVLPILMTLINIVSGMIYTRGQPLRSKIQLYGMALVFLVLLYNSPAGLVFYWTLNNLFSLGKNILEKLPNPKRVLRIGCSVLGLALGVFAALRFNTFGGRKGLWVIAAAAALQLPLVLELVRKAVGKKKAKGEQATGTERMMRTVGRKKTEAVQTTGPELSNAGQSEYAAKSEKAEETKTVLTEQTANTEETGKTGTAKTEIGKPGTTKKETGKTGIEKTETGKTGNAKHYRAIFFTACVLLTILTGLLIPSTIIHDSPGEFVEMDAFRSPLHFVLHAFLLAAGTFLIWSVIYYLLAEERRKPAFALVFAAAAVAALVNYMFFGNGYGNMSSTFVYDKDVTQSISLSDKLLNAGILLAIAGVVWVLWKKKAVALRIGTGLMCLVIGGMSMVNIFGVGAQVPELRRLAAQQENTDDIIHLDRKGRNVVVLMLDRAINYFVPFMMEEKPELREQFAGFTYYPNTLSYGHNTNVGTPPLFGGYEYVPEKVNARSDVLLKDKQNEALRLMPLNFLKNGFEVTVCDPPLSNYTWIPDLTVYDDVPEIRGFVTNGRVYDDSTFSGEARNKVRERNAFCYSVFRIAPLFVQSELYDSGSYNETDVTRNAEESLFVSYYTFLKNLPRITQVSESGQDEFLMLASNITHEPLELQEPEYEPRDYVDNTAYDAEHPVRVDADGWELPLQIDAQREHYQTNMAALLVLGKWLDYLREQGVYDNTRIIIVADHGENLGYGELWVEAIGQSLMQYNPLLMVKDFDCTNPIQTDDTFMTQADTPTIAFRGLVENPVNPATGVAVTDEDKSNDEQVVCSTPWNISVNAGTTFKDSQYFVLRNHDVLNPENWGPYTADQ